MHWKYVNKGNTHSFQGMGRCDPMNLSIFPFAGSGDIYNGSIKLILGLIWTLILHYQISAGLATIDSGEEKGKESGKTGKQALLEWLQVSL